MAESTNPRMEGPRIYTKTEIAGIKARILLAVGSKDALIRSEESAARLGRAQRGAEIRMLPGAGHALIGLGTDIATFLDRDQ